jgi:hypothetical protein
MSLPTALAPLPALLARHVPPHSTRRPGIGGCTLYLRDPILHWLALTNAFGAATTELFLTVDPALRGMPFFAQAFVADPRTAQGIAFTAGLGLAPVD